MSEEEDFEDATDVADRLIQLMRKIEQTASSAEITLDNGQPRNGLRVPLYKAFEPIALQMNFTDYSELRDNFVELCRRVQRDIYSLDLKRSKTKERWIEAVKTASDIFDASNFNEQCSTIFRVNFAPEVYEKLEDASERLITEGRKEASKDQLKEALEAVRNVLKTYEKHGNLPPELNKILLHYLQQIEESYQRYEDFGEETFWATYKELFSTFIQVHSAIMPEKNCEEAESAFKTALSDMCEKMKYGLPALSVTVNVATLGAIGVSLLQ